MDNSAIAEAIRRRQGQVPSAAGMPGANVNPMARSAQAVQRPTNMAGGSPLVNQIKQAPEDKELLIIKALIQKLRDMTPKEPQQ